MMSIEEHLAALQRAGDDLARVADRSTLDSPVPSCPDWRVRDLVQHTGAVHRWATHIVDTAQPTRPPSAERDRIAKTWGPDAELIDWFRAGHRDLLAALRAAPDELSCYAFLPADSPRAFWARRQAHETTIHRIDAQLAAGEPTPVEPATALDGVDELLRGFFGRGAPPPAEGSSQPIEGPPPPVDGPAAGGRLLLVTASDAGRSWPLRIDADRIEFDPGADPGSADCVLTGPSAVLYPALWNRGNADGLAVAGDAGLLERWHSLATIRWA